MSKMRYSKILTLSIDSCLHWIGCCYSSALRVGDLAILNFKPWWYHLKIRTSMLISIDNEVSRIVVNADEYLLSINKYAFDAHLKIW